MANELYNGLYGRNGTIRNIANNPMTQYGWDALIGLASLGSILATGGVSLPIVLGGISGGMGLNYLANPSTGKSAAKDAITGGIIDTASNLVPGGSVFNAASGGLEKQALKSAINSGITSILNNNIPQARAEQ